MQAFVRSNMRWNDRVFRGTHGPWSWVVASDPIPGLEAILKQTHAGDVLWLATFDSGLIAHGPQDAARGWRPAVEGMFHPELKDSVEIPQAGWDEWYILEPGCVPEAPPDRFVNYVNFNLADTDALVASYDPTWERDALDWLGPIQQRFWLFMERLMPITYLGLQDRTILATRNTEFNDSVQKLLG